jgi:hypothetical protein
MALFYNTIYIIMDIIMGKGRGGRERELERQESLRVFLEELSQKYERRKEDILLLLEELIKTKGEALRALGQTRVFIRHLTMGQRRNLGGPFLALPSGEGIGRGEEAFLRSGLQGPGLFRPLREDRGVKKNLRELRQSQIVLLSMIGELKKNLLRLDFLELRTGELILSLRKATEAFRREYRMVRLRLFPLGLFSKFLRGLRRLFGGYYFSRRDCGELGTLGVLGRSMLEIAGSPVC